MRADSAVDNRHADARTVETVLLLRDGGIHRRGAGLKVAVMPAPERTDPFVFVFAGLMRVLNNYVHRIAARRLLQLARDFPVAAKTEAGARDEQRRAPKIMTAIMFSDHGWPQFVSP